MQLCKNTFLSVGFSVSEWVSLWVCLWVCYAEMSPKNAFFIRTYRLFSCDYLSVCESVCVWVCESVCELRRNVPKKCFLAATKQLCKPTFLSVCESVCESSGVFLVTRRGDLCFWVCPSVRWSVTARSWENVQQDCAYKKKSLFGHPKGRPLFLSPLVGWLVSHSKMLRKCPTSFFYKNSF